MRLVLVPITAAACASVTPPDLPDPLIEVGDGTVRSVDDTISMSFASQGDIRLPDRLEIGGRSVLGDSSCPDESLVGFGLFPAATLSADTTLAKPSSDLIVLQDGPFIAQFQTTFSVNYTCDGDHTASGDTVFTVFPNGRIVRQDRDVLPSGETLNASGSPCSCSSSAQTFFFTSYWAFESDGTVFHDATDSAITLNGDQTPIPADRACAVLSGDLALGVVWDVEEEDVNPVRVRQVPGGAAAIVFDFVRSLQTLVAEPRTKTSKFFFGPTCSQALAGLETPLLVINGDQVGADPDGIYRDFTVRLSEFEIRPLDQEIPAGFAISLDLDGHAVITRSDDGEVFVQREQGTRSVLYFPDALEPDDIITIRPE